MALALLLPGVNAAASSGERCSMSAARSACRCPSKSYPCDSVAGRSCCEVEANDLPQLPATAHDQPRLDPPQAWTALPPPAGPSLVASKVPLAAPLLARGPPGDRGIWLLVSSLLL